MSQTTKIDTNINKLADKSKKKNAKKNLLEFYVKLFTNRTYSVSCPGIVMILKIMDQISKFPMGCQIRAARCLLGITQEQCAKYTGVSLSTLKKYENINNNELVLKHIRYDKVMLILNYFESVDVQFANAEDRIGVYLIVSQ